MTADKATLKQMACAAIDARRQDIFALGRDILCHPELGYKEQYASRRMAELLPSLGVTNMQPVALTGLKGWLQGGSHTARVAVLGELDAVISPQHPQADPATGAAHACGHNAQLAALAGCVIGLGPLMPQLDGDVCILCAPAEEYVDLTFRQQLMEQGKIAWLGGKQQMIIEGAFDDVDMAMMIHSETDAPHPRVVTGGASLGFIGKQVRFTGREAHAGAAPHLGVNALNAASLAIQAIHAQRETFRDEDRVRVHPILTKGGDIVNTVPADVRMESYVRAATLPAVQDANAKVNRAIRGAAYAIGAEADIQDTAGYLPLAHNPGMSRLFASNAEALLPTAEVASGLPFGGSTDMGDLSWLLPVIHPTVSGFTGAAHSCDFSIQDEEMAYIVPAKLLAMTVIDLLAEKAETAAAVRQGFARKTPQEYAALWQALLARGEAPL